MLAKGQFLARTEWDTSVLQVIVFARSLEMCESDSPFRERNPTDTGIVTSMPTIAPPAGAVGQGRRISDLGGG